MSVLQVLLANSGPYAYWNPADAGGAITLSNANLTAAHSTSPGMVRANKSVTGTQKKYWEVRVDSGGDNGLIGMANGSLSTGSYPGATSDGFGWSNSGTVIYAGATAITIDTWSAGDVLGFLCDLSTSTTSFYKNGVLQGSTLGIAYVGAMVYPCFGGAGNATTVTARFGLNVSYSIPSGATLLTL